MSVVDKVIDANSLGLSKIYQHYGAPKQFAVRQDQIVPVAVPSLESVDTKLDGRFKADNPIEEE